MITLPDLKSLLCVLSREATCARHKKVLSHRQESWTRTRQRLLSSLQAAGCRRKGEGAFAVTLVKGRWALKVVRTKESKNALSYLRYSRRHHRTNPLLPRVRLMRQIGALTVVVMERLSHCRPVARKLCRQLRRWERTLSMDRITHRSFTHQRAHLAQVLDRLNALRRHLKTTRRWGELDFHAGNVLFRSQRGRLYPVINDPVSG